MKETIAKINKTKSWFFEKIKKIEIISSIFSDHNAMRLPINCGKSLKNINTWRLNNTLLSTRRSLKKSKRK